MPNLYQLVRIMLLASPWFFISCSVMPHASYPLAVMPTIKPMYDSVVRVSVPVHAGLGIFNSANAYSPSSKNSGKSNLNSGFVETGISVSSKWFSAGASSFFYFGTHNSYRNLSSNDPSFENNNNFYGTGFRLNVSLDHQLKPYVTSNYKGKAYHRLSTWRILNVQANYASEYGKYNQLRAYLINRGIEYRGPEIWPSNTLVMHLLIYSEFAAFNYAQNIGGTLGLGVLIPFVVDNEMNHNHRPEGLTFPAYSVYANYKLFYKNTFAQLNLNMGIFSFAGFVLSGYSPPINMSLSVGYLFPIK